MIMPSMETPSSGQSKALAVLCYTNLLPYMHLVEVA